MRLVSLGMWPDTAHLENEYQGWPDGPMVNAIGRFALGLSPRTATWGRSATSWGRPGRRVELSEAEP